ncbi:hypothetical protein [Marinobacter salarius]|uniref:Uncharacterized protein n=1 Tax=Marinobacter salarius TaxID=1420917 RepID=A0A1W6KFH7_9GAMM|nr:hypothetical protein [Marinobacter salarius]ARM86151.1 hypothetical protein MARSALSMR5_04131 [Marinobacter salarius]
MSYSLIERPDTVGSINLSTMVPNGDHFVTTYGDLLNPGESLPLITFAKRIKKHYPSPFVQIEADELIRWQEFMAYAEDCVINHDELPDTLSYHDGHYSEAEIHRILGDKAVDWLTRQTTRAA